MARNAIPAMYEEAGFVEGGGLMSYGPSVRDLFRRSGRRGMSARTHLLDASRGPSVCLLDFRDDELSISPKGGRSLAGGASLPRRDCSAATLWTSPTRR